MATTSRQPLFIEDVEAGLELPALVKQPSQVALFRFSAVTWNAHRIHYDRDYAATEDYPNVLVQGHLHGAYLTQMLLDWIGPTGTLRRFQWSNRRPAFPGDTLTCRGRVTRVYREGDFNLVECEIWEENQNGEACAPGSATVSLPSRRDRR
jgi:hydroxyacyl-ACP dehydratase HTD2-like protein with hotdog domain